MNTAVTSLHRETGMNLIFSHKCHTTDCPPDVTVVMVSNLQRLYSTTAFYWLMRFLVACCELKTKSEIEMTEDKFTYKLSVQTINTKRGKS